MSQNNFEYINLKVIDYKYNLNTNSVFEPSHFVSSIQNDMENRSMLSLSKKQSGLSQQGKKKQKKKQKKKPEKKEEVDELKLSKQDSKNGIYSLIPKKKQTKKKPNQKEIQEKFNRFQQQTKDPNNLLAFIEKKKVEEQSKQDQGEVVFSNKQNKKKKCKKPLLTKAIPSQKEEQEGNKKVDDFIKSIKAKNEKKEKEKMKDSFRNQYLKKYKYIFSLDPTNRFRIRNESTKIENDVIFDLFKTISNLDTIEEKDEIKEILTMIDNIGEILLSNKNFSDLISIFVNETVNLILKHLESFNDLKAIMILNEIYTLFKIKTESENINLGNNFDFIISKIKELLEGEISKEHQTNFTLEGKLISLLYIYFLVNFLSDKGYDQYSSTIEKLLEKAQKKFEVPKTEKEKEDFTEFKSKHILIKFLLKFNTLFDLKKDSFYSLGIRTTKLIENQFNKAQIIISEENNSKFVSMISSLLYQYVIEFDLFYELDSTLYDSLFGLLKLLCENNDKEKYHLLSQVEANNLSFSNDDSLVKYILIIMKIFSLFDKENLGNEYTKYFFNVIEFIFDLNQNYLKEKYQILLKREIDSKMNETIANDIFKNILDKIEFIIKTQEKIKLPRAIKELNNFIMFFSYNNLINQIALDYANKLDDSTESQIYLVFLVSLLNENFSEKINFNKIAFFNSDLINFILHYYISQELQKIKFIFDKNIKLNEKEIKAETYKNLINEVNGMNPYNVIYNLTFIEKNNFGFDFESLSSILKIKNEKNKKFIDAFVLYYLNCTNKINDEVKQMYPNDIDFEKEIQKVNDKKGKFEEKYLNGKFDKLMGVLIEIRKVDDILQADPEHFKYEDILVEEVKLEKKEETEGKEELFPDENNKEENKKEEEIKEKNKKLPQISKANLDIILQVFIETLSLPEFKFNFQNKQEVSIDELINIFFFCQIESFIFKTLSNDIIFSHLSQSAQLLSKFMKEYIIFKDAFSLLKYNLESVLSQLSDSYKLISESDKIYSNLQIITLLSKCETSITNIIVSRCSGQLVYLFPEKEIYQLLHTENRKFLQTVSNNLDTVYKNQILNQEKISDLLKKAQDEEEDYLEEVVYEIFSKDIIKYLENPKEIIELLTTINDGMKYDISTTKNKFYESIFPYFYIWKCIMIKIENGFKLFTANKEHVAVIENYKTLLKFIINYLERNSKLYEMFLLIIVSLLHLIDDKIDDEDISFENFNDEQLTDSFDLNTYQFLLSILFKFVKIFPSLVKFYYDESKNKLKSIFKNLICTMILPKLLRDLREKIKTNEKVLNSNQIYLGDFVSNHYLQFYFSPIDELKLEIEIKIPPIFPLKKLDIDIKCNASIDERKKLNIKMNLNHTLNSSIDNISDNLIIWKEDVKQLIISGNDPCPICYFYLHTTDKSLPNIHCPTCKKKFHGLCVKEWFKNLNQNGQNSTCPMCRSEWKLYK